ncbi:PRD domain-containing protein [Agromyces sp. ISL-38]|uniref:BglG family transcription antiterminator n=1 Tax=Agromyces sp. ISL-38 TaxID=2819107 RepID=UPI001BE7EC22|nr:PTS sugar transporter subunit IIA [Agromyces sp. ISL-38]MBT2498677.1 PRD domain-containing protein [Agromyces sp. ISL-38]MBT2518544.1 PRD domain-containing protein [Streptomyces sp. ISL-90]
MAEKWERLVEVLAREHDWTTAGALADRLGVTARTIRSYVAQANSTGGPVIVSGPLGYRLDRSAWAARGALAPSDVSPAARAARVIRSLIDADDGLDVFEAAADLHVSESTIESDLGRIRTRLDGSALSLVRTGPRVSLTGPESARRRLLGVLFREESARGMLELDELRSTFPELPAFRGALVTGLAEAGFAPNEYGLNDVLLHIAIALDRVARDHPLDADDAVPDRSARADTDAAADDRGRLVLLLDRLIGEHFGISIGEAELGHLARLLQTRAATRTTSSATTDAAAAPQSARVGLVRAIVARAAAEYLIELDDGDFVERLALHVDNLVARAQEQRYSRNPLTTTIKSAYPLIYDLAVYIASELQRTEGIVVNDDEIAYIAMHVGANLDRRRAVDERVRAAIVAPAYHDVHTALAARIRAAFGDDLELVSLIDHADVEWASLPAELVISVVEPAMPVERLVLVAPFPTEGDLDRVRSEIGRIRRARRRGRLAASLSRYIAPELFVRGMRGLDREGVIRSLGDRMIAQDVIDQAYVEGAIERERMSSTAFTEQLAVPHAMTMTAKRTAIAIAIDETPLDWAGARVNVVALIAFSEAGRAEFQDVFDQFVEAFSERENVQRLVHGARDYPGLLVELAHLMEP